MPSLQTASLSTGTKTPAPATLKASKTPDNEFNKPEDALKWAKARGLELPSIDSAPEGDFTIRTLRYKGASGEVSPAFVTAGLFTACTKINAAQTEVMDHIAPELIKAEVKTHPARSNELGIFATAKIPIGKNIISERPSIILPTHLRLGGMSLRKDELLSQLFRRLPVDQHNGEVAQGDGIRTLYFDPGRGTSREEGIVRDNGFNITLEGENQSYSGLFLTLSRCNHRYFASVLIAI